MNEPKSIKSYETVTLPDGNRLSGYEGEFVFESIRKGRGYFEQSMLERWFLPRALGLQCVYDIGANLGNHSVYFGTHSKAAIYSFEPVPQTFDLLKTNVEQNGLGERVKLFPFALGAEEGVSKMQEDAADMGKSKISESGSVQVSVKRLDDLSLPPPDFVKMDVESYEMQVLKGMERTLRESSSVLWIEIWPYAEGNEEKYEFLSSLGYIPVDLNPFSDIVFAKTGEDKLKGFCKFVSLVNRVGRERVKAVADSVRQEMRTLYERRGS